VAGAEGLSEEGGELWGGGGGSWAYRKSQKPKAGLDFRLTWK